MKSAASTLKAGLRPGGAQAEGVAGLARLSPDLLMGPPVVVVGAGPAGVAVAEGLVGAADAPPVVLIGEEADAPYNRIHLTPFLAGQLPESGLRIGAALDHADRHRFARVPGCRIAEIDAERMVVADERGGELLCSRIVLATGSWPVLPPIPGIERAGVHTFRTLADARALGAVAPRATRAVVIGGGLLGLEAARALAGHGCPISVVEQSQRLMPAQLDEEASRRLAGMLEADGVDVRLGVTVERFEGAGGVTSAVLGDGVSIGCDLVVVAAGVRPNAELASEAGLATNRGIVVDRYMRTSVPTILAVGECAEFEGTVQGLAGPALAQARVAADSIRRRDRPYVPAAMSTRLKVFDRPVFSVGTPDQPGRRIEWSGDGAYRRLTLYRGRVVAAAGIGEWPQLHDVQRAVADRRLLWPWQAAAFRKHGTWTRRTASPDPAAWQPERIVCNCTQTTCGQLRAARESGCRTADALQARTGASRVCGSCHDQIAAFADLVPANGPHAGTGRRWRVLASLVAVAVAAFAFLPRVPAPASVDGIGFDLSMLWRDGVWRQATGYLLVAGLVILTGLSARRRMKRFRVSTPAFWRWCHGVAGMVVLVVAGIHTGFDAGAGLTTWLLTLLAVLSLAGALAGAIGPGASAGLRRTVFWGHLLLAWPLPVLLGFHVLSIYWF